MTGMDREIEMPTSSLEKSKSGRLAEATCDAGERGQRQNPPVLPRLGCQEGMTFPMGLVMALPKIPGLRPRI